SEVAFSAMVGTLKETISLVQPQSAEIWATARRLVEEYAASPNLDLSFQDFERETNDLSGEYGAPMGAFLVAQENGRPIGCVGLRKFADGVGEIKRLYVISGARGCGVGRALAEAIIASAKQVGYRRLVLDTLSSMENARSLYLSLGFRPIAPYRFNPVPGTVYLGLEID
ncbi:MAG: GNAT family N-acetyltransferase, partial [Burkholderiales bacterium]